MLAERFLDERRLLGARFDFPHFALEADRRRDFERPLDALRFFEQLLLRDLLRLREPPRFPDLLRLRDPERFPEQLRFLERLRDLRPLEAERLLLPVKRSTKLKCFASIYRNISMEIDLLVAPTF